MGPLWGAGALGSGAEGPGCPRDSRASVAPEIGVPGKCRCVGRPRQPRLVATAGGRALRGVAFRSGKEARRSGAALLTAAGQRALFVAGVPPLAATAPGTSLATTLPIGGTWRCSSFSRTPRPPRQHPFCLGMMPTAGPVGPTALVNEVGQSARRLTGKAGWPRAGPQGPLPGAQPAAGSGHWKHSEVRQQHVSEQRGCGKGTQPGGRAVTGRRPMTLRVGL